MYFDISLRSIVTSSEFQGKVGHQKMRLISILSYNFTDVPKMFFGSDPQGQGSKLRKSLSRQLATKWSKIVAKCKFLVAKSNRDTIHRHT